MTIVSGPPFAGKGRFSRDEVARREAAGELGLVMIDFTGMYGALVPGIQSSYRDERIRDTGAARWVAYLYEVAVRQAADRELDGYITTDSPRRAIALAERFPGARIVEVQATMGELVARTKHHLSELARKVPRARTETRAAADAAADATGKCSQALIAFLREKDKLAGIARGVRRIAKTATKPARWESTGAVQAFDRGLWLSGLTEAGQRAVKALVAAGTAEPGPRDVMRYLLTEAGRR